MKLNELLADDRAISPVVGVALLIGITVILAAVIGGVVLGIGVGPTEAPSAQLDAEFNDLDDDGTYENVTIEHNGGDPLDPDEVVIKDSDGNEESMNLTAGESEVYGDASLSGDLSEVSVVWQDPESDQETELAQIEN